VLPKRVHSSLEGLIGWVRQTGQGMLVGDYEAEWERLPARPSYQSEHPARSSLFAPLIAGGETIGVIAVQSDDDILTRRLRLSLCSPTRLPEYCQRPAFEQTQRRNRHAVSQ
jgi:hypothetical protein